RGPRFETVAEIAALAKVADLVGMTIASEATLARELGIPFAALSTVDNYANGLTEESLSWDEVLEISRQYRDRTGGILNMIMKQMG
ncbi:MAG: 5'-methylthioadenosine phosphorylase, partial [Methanoregula sp.]|nr:5'-methylthioadenosine phosphorylase [Methanoregula sp.]